MSGDSRALGKPRAADLWGLAFAAMRQQKVRTALTLIGVVVGTFTLVLSLAVGRGVDRAIVNLFHDDDRLRKVQVMTKYEPSAEDVPADRREPKGPMSDAKRARIRTALVRDLGGFRRQRVRLTPEAIRRLEAIEHVATVVPSVRLGGRAMLDGKGDDIMMTSIAPRTDYLRDRLIAGRLFTPDDGRAAIVHEYLLYRWGLVRDADAESALGRTFRLEFRPPSPETFDLTQVLRRGQREVGERESRALEAALKRLAVLVRFLPMPRDERDVLQELFEHISATSQKAPSKTYAEEFTIVGVLRERGEEDREPLMFGDFGVGTDEVLLPAAAAVAFVLPVPEVAKEGFDSVVVTVDREEAVRDVARRIERMGFQQFSLGEFIDTVRMSVLLISAATAFVAFVALIVAAIGITNTMIMSVLERTHEIGIMKALGARDRHILLIFVVEGILMGLLGSGLGMALSWLASFPGDSIARSLMEPQIHPSLRGAMKVSLLAFPMWLVAGVPALVSLITTLAAWYPASRAARVDPVTSLRHE
jgi:putative ABC transport system permease protein